MKNKDIKIKKGTKKDKKTEKTVEEVTTSASAGAYESPLVIYKRDGINETRHLTIEDISSSVKRVLINELFNQNTPTMKGVFNAPKIPTNATDASKNTTKSQKAVDKLNTSTIKDTTKKVEAFEKDNVTEKVKDPNRKLTDTEKIIARSGGMQDIEYDSEPTEEWKKKVKKEISGEGYADNAATDTSKVNDQIMGDAKKRKDMRDELKIPTFQSGSHVEFFPKNVKADTKNLAFENTIKKYKFNQEFLDESRMLRKIPKIAKEHNNIFEMSDGIDKFKVLWEGCDKGGHGIVLEHKNQNTIERNKQFYNKMFHKKVINESMSSSKLNENKIFKTLLKSNNK